MATNWSTRRITDLGVAVVLAACAGAWAIGRRDDAIAAIAPLVVISLACIGLGAAFRRGHVVTLGAGLLGTAIVVAEVGHPVSAAATILPAGLLLASLELAFSACSITSGWPSAPRGRQLSTTATALVGGAVAALVVNTAAIAGRGAGVAVFALGALAAVVLVLALACAYSRTGGPVRRR